MMDRAKQTGGYLRRQGMLYEHKASKRFRKWRDKQRKWKTEKATIEIECPLEAAPSASMYPPTIAFPGPGCRAGVNTPDLGAPSIYEARATKKAEETLKKIHHEMTTRLQVTGKVLEC